MLNLIKVRKRMKRIYVIFAFFTLIFCNANVLAKSINNEILPTTKNVYQPFECSLSVVSVNSLAAMDIMDTKPGYVSGNDYFIRYESENSGYVYIFVERSNGSVELFFPSKEHDDNYVEANKRYIYPSAFPNITKVVSPTGVENWVMYVVPEKFSCENAEWLRKSFSQNRCMTEFFRDTFYKTRPHIDSLSYDYFPKLNSGSADDFFKEVSSQATLLWENNWSSYSESYNVYNESKEGHVFTADLRNNYSWLNEDEKRAETEYFFNQYYKDAIALRKGNIPDGESISEKAALELAKEALKKAIEDCGHSYTTEDFDVNIVYFETNTIYNDWWDIYFTYKHLEESYTTDFIFNMNSMTGEIEHLCILNRIMPEEYKTINLYQIERNRVFDGDYVITIIDIFYYEDDPHPQLGEMKL